MQLFGFMKIYFKAIGYQLSAFRCQFEFDRVNAWNIKYEFLHYVLYRSAAAWGFLLTFDFGLSTFTPLRTVRLPPWTFFRLLTFDFYSATLHTVRLRLGSTFVFFYHFPIGL